METANNLSVNTPQAPQSEYSEGLRVKRASPIRKLLVVLFSCEKCDRLGYKCRDCWYDEAH